MYLTDELRNEKLETKVRVSIWRLDPILEAVMLHSVDIFFDEGLEILEDSLFFSNNGEFVYFLLYNTQSDEL